jgi:hypothetical protein
VTPVVVVSQEIRTTKRARHAVRGYRAVRVCLVPELVAAR